MLRGKYFSFLLVFLGSLFLYVNIFFILPSLIFLLFYGKKIFLFFSLIGSVGDISFLTSIFSFSPSVYLLLFVFFVLLSLAVVGIFLYKKWGYKISVGVVWLFSFVAMLAVVVKTYLYMPNFICSVVSGSILVVGGFLSWFSCFRGYKQRKFLPYWVPFLLWIFSFLLFVFLLVFFPDPSLPIDYSTAFGSGSSFVLMPWVLDSKEFIFAGCFLFLLLVSRFSIVSFVSFSSSYKQTKIFSWKLFFYGILVVFFLGGVVLMRNKSLFFSPSYNLHQYDSVFTKTGYKEQISSGDNIYYRQNIWMSSHTGFLHQIEKNSYVSENYFSQSGYIMSGFTDFWKEFSGLFYSEFSGVLFLNTGYSVADIYDYSLPSPDQKIRERSRLINAVALHLCMKNSCEEGFSFRKGWYPFVRMRLTSGPILIESLVLRFAIQDSFSSLELMIPYLTSQQKQEAINLLESYDIPSVYKNIMIHEYFFVRWFGIESIQNVLKDQHIMVPNFILDFDYTDFLMKKYFANVMDTTGFVGNWNSDDVSFRYNLNGFFILNALLPRITNIYSRLEAIEEQRKSILFLLQNDHLTGGITEACLREGKCTMHVRK